MRASLYFAKISLDFAPHLFNRIQVRTVGRQISDRGFGCFNGFTDAAYFVAGKIVHHYNIALTQMYHKMILHIILELFTSHGSIYQHRYGCTIQAHGRNNGCGLAPV